MGAASLYWHVRDKEELLSLLLDRIVGEASVPDPDPENWREQVKQMARENRRLLQSHRDAAQISLGRIPIGPHSVPVLERNLALLRASGLPPRVIALAADMFALFVGGFAFEESMDNSEPADAGAARRVLPLAAARGVPDARRARRRAGRGRARRALRVRDRAARARARGDGRRRLAGEALVGQFAPGALGLAQIRRAPSRAAPARAFVNWTSPYSTTSTWLPHGSVKRRLPCGSSPASSSAARTASRSSTTSPKWRSSSLRRGGPRRARGTGRPCRGRPSPAPARAARTRTAARRGRARRRDRRPRAPRG